MLQNFYLVLILLNLIHLTGKGNVDRLYCSCSCGRRNGLDSAYDRNLKSESSIPSHKKSYRLLSSTEYDNCPDNEENPASVSLERTGPFSLRNETKGNNSLRCASNLSGKNTAVNGGVECYDRNSEIIVYLGIIDVLQCYKFKKKLEHALKTTVLSMDEISICHPRLYATRFYRFLSRTAFKKRLSIFRLPPSYDSMTLTSASYFSSGLGAVSNDRPALLSEEIDSANTQGGSLNSIDDNVLLISPPLRSPLLLKTYVGSSVDRDSGIHTSESQRSRK
ncbi:hypothetical protein ACOME3_008653 [Neoechinorhynchus agilis]